MRALRLVRALVALVLTGLTASSASAATVRTFDNGLEARVQHLRTGGRVAVVVSYAVGERDDPPGQRGLVSLVGGMLHHQTPATRPGGLLRELRAMGARHDTEVTPDRLTYSTEISARALERVLWLEGSRMALRPDRIVPSELSAARGRRSALLRAGGRHRQLQRRALLHVLVPVGHAYAAMAAPARGFFTLTPREALPLSAVRRFARAHVRPSRATVVIAGDVGEAEALALVERYLGRLTDERPRPPRSTEPEPQPAARVRATLETTAVRERALHGWLVPPAGAAPSRALEVVSEFLRRRSGPLYAPLVGGGLVTRYRVGVRGGELASTFIIALDLAAGADRSEVRYAMNRIMRRLPSSLTEPRFQAARRSVAVSDVLAMERPRVVATHWLRRGRLPSPDGWNALRREEVVEAAKRWLHPRHMASLLVLPAATAKDDGRFSVEER